MVNLRHSTSPYGPHSRTISLLSRNLILLGLIELTALTALSRAESPVQGIDKDPKTPAHAQSSHKPDPTSANYDELIITGVTQPRTRFDVIQSTSVLSQEALQVAMMPTLGETLSELPGISSTYFGPGASRPVIRGMDGPRVRVLLNGLGSLDASVTSPDHAVGTEGLLTSRIEVIRGAGTLLYGSSSIGGVVNVDDGRIPLELPSGPIEGEVRALYNSAASDKGASLGLTTGAGPVALRASGAFAQSNDLSIPGYAVSDALEAEQPGIERGPLGVALSTQTDRLAGTVGGAWVSGENRLGLSYGVIDSHYGSPSEPGEPIEIDLHQKRVDAQGEWSEPLPYLRKAEFKYGYSDYAHDEIEEEEGVPVVASSVMSHAHEVRLDLFHDPIGSVNGRFGVQLLHRDFNVEGAEAFVPDSTTENWGFFVLEEYERGPVRVEMGARAEHQSIQSDKKNFSRDFNAFSFSLGASYSFLDGWITGLSLSRTERPPAAEELLSNGAHLATGGFDVGDPDLVKESGVMLEGTLKRRVGRWTGALNLYWSGFSDFIYQENGEYCDVPPDTDPDNPICVANPAGGELQKREFVQNDVDFWGGEVLGSYRFYESEHYTGALDIAFDWVRAELADGSGGTIPRIPPHRLKFGLEGKSRYADLRGEIWWVGAQDRVAENELPTNSYLMLNVILTAHPFPNQRNVTLVAQGRNLLNEEARIHSSFLKDKLPLGGREARLNINVAF
jgi:iron complex outermembrane receptor protein